MGYNIGIQATKVNRSGDIDGNGDSGGTNSDGDEVVAVIRL